MRVRIGGHSVAIQIVDKVDDAHSSGEYDPAAQTIKIESRLCPSMKCETFLHELTHAMITGLPISDDLEEILACIVGSKLWAFIRDNPEIVCSLIQVATEENETNG